MRAMNKTLVLVSVLSVCMLLSSASDLSSDRAALLVLRHAVGGRVLLWNTSASPCTWTGVYCANDRVTMLRFPGMGLSGQLPSGLGNLTCMHTLSLRYNALKGSLPGDLVNLVNMRYLYLQGNSFSGEIPLFLFRMHYLVRLNLGGNGFTGGISGEFNRLTRLGSLFLEGNMLSGSIPELELPDLKQFNVSFNQLTGSVPLSLSGMPGSAFEGNSLCGKPLKSCDGDRGFSGGRVAGIVIGSVVGMLVLVGVLILLCRRKRSGGVESRDGLEEKRAESGVFGSSPRSGPAGVEAGKIGGIKGLVFFGKRLRSYDFEALLKASAEVLGKGTFGTTYKAILDKGGVVAVKRLKDATEPELEFRQKIEAVGAMTHENLVPLRSYFYSRDEQLLVYDYMPMGSLSALLHGNKGADRTPLNWDTRYAIALGAARGIAYLHSVSPETSHGNIKSSNILLSTSYESRVSDFGLAQLASPTSNTSSIAGYRAPEVTDSRYVSQKADVYSFGVFLLELLTGRAPTNAGLNEEGINLPRWVQSVVKEQWTAEVFDVELLRYQNVEEDMVQLLQLALNCTAEYPDSRPLMAEVASRIEEICPASPQEIEDIS